MTTINAVNNPQINHAEFVKLTVGTAQTVYTFCNAAAPVTVSGNTFTNLGALLSVGDVQRDIKATSDDMTIQLTGINPTYVGLILSSEIKGSLVEVWRGFLNSNNQIITTPTTQFFKRYQGIISSVSITEDFNSQTRTRIATCSIACSSMRRVLENRLSGIRTNQKNWQLFYSGDTSMNRVAQIANTYFNFGTPPTTNTQATDTTTKTSDYENEKVIP